MQKGKNAIAQLMDVFQKMKTIRKLGASPAVVRDFTGFTKFSRDKERSRQENLESFGLFCLNPSYIFNKLISEEQPRSVILTSGTLNPLSVLKKELAVDFKV